jgi:flagellar motor switch protein FliM
MIQTAVACRLQNIKSLPDMADPENTAQPLIMEPTWIKADFRDYGKLQHASSDLLRSTQEVLGRELGLSLSAFLRCSVTSVFKNMNERPFGDLQQEASHSCLGVALVRPDDRCLLVALDYPVLYQLIGISLGAKLGSFTSPDRKPTDIELQVVNILFRLILSEAYRGWLPLIKTQLETVTIEFGRGPSRAFQSTDSVLVIRFDLTVGEHSGSLSLIVPPELFQSAVAAEEPLRHERMEMSGATEITLQLMLPAKVSIDVWLDGSQMRLRDLLHLREGQIVKLDHPVERKAVCTLNGKAGFNGQIVSTGAKRAFMVDSPLGTQS